MCEVAIQVRRKTQFEDVFAHRPLFTQPEAGVGRQCLGGRSYVTFCGRPHEWLTGSLSVVPKTDAQVAVRALQAVGGRCLKLFNHGQLRVFDTEPWQFAHLRRVDGFISARVFVPAERGRWRQVVQLRCQCQAQ